MIRSLIAAALVHTYLVYYTLRIPKKISAELSA